MDVLKLVTMQQHLVALPREVHAGRFRGTRATAYGKGGGSTRHFGLLNRFGCLVYERNALPIISCSRCSFLQLERGVPAIGVLRLTARRLVDVRRFRY
ncbi:unnamed protein product [uncultured bacterium]|nr:unnamed protein product [uncultured bacterium]